MPTFTGTEGNDTHTGTSEADIINGLGGNDILNGGDGNDEIDGGSGQDQTFGDGGNDILIVSAAPVSGEVYNGGADTDTLRVLTTAGTLGSTPSGPSYLVSMSVATVTAIERLEYGSIDGFGLTVVLSQAQTSGLTDLVGGAGNDSLVIFATVAGAYTIQSFTYTNWTNADEAFEVGDVVTLTGSGSGNFTLNAAVGHLGYQALTGANGNDTLNGTDGMEVLNGGGGVNMLNAGGGDDILVAQNFTPFGGVYTNRNFAGNVFDGGDGFDWLSVGGYVNFQGDLVSIEGINFLPAVVASGPGTSSQSEAELEIAASTDGEPAELHLRGTGTLSIELDDSGTFDMSDWVHEAGSNVFVQIFGTAGDETLIGTSGNDRFSGGFGTSTMTGGAGDDQFEAGEGQVTVTDFTVGEDRIDVQDLNFTSFQQALDHMTEIDGNVVIFRTYNGTAQMMTLLNVTMAELTAESFIFQTGDEDDTRIGTDLEDELIGAFGADTLEGLGGNDFLFGGDNDDSLDGGAGDDLLYGGNGDDGILGGAGTDRLFGGAGVDTLAGGADGDIYEADEFDTIVENADEGDDVVLISTSYTLGANVEQLTFTGEANVNGTGNGLNNIVIGNGGNNVLMGLGGDDMLTGNLGDDTLDGGDGNDRLSSGPGNDILLGGAGDDRLLSNTGTDTLTGGSGNDTFVEFASTLSGDTITDFGVGDRIHFLDGNLATFTFSLSGNTLTYSGGSVTLQAGVNGTLVASSAADGGVQITIQAAPADVRNDFNGDGRSDILWRHTDGTIGDWLANADGTHTSNGASVTPVPNNWQIVGTGDFNGDGRDDILWRSNAGEVGNWLADANGAFAYNAAAGVTVIPLSWQVEAVGDFNADGRDDILWRHTDGTVGVWSGQANGGYVANNAAVFNVSTDWQIVGTGDFNGDGRDDILWRHDSGSFADWLANDSGGFAPNNPSLVAITADWHIIGTGDFNGDGRDDILWRHDSGTSANWTANADGTFSPNFASLLTITNDWNAVSTGDYNGDGRDDILWRHDSGTIANWLANTDNSGTFTTNNASFAGVPNDWQVQDPATLFL